MSRRILLGVLIVGALSIVAIAVTIGSRPEPVPQFTTEHYAIRIVTVVTRLTHPWSLAFLPDGDMLVTERDGALRRIHNGALQRRSIAGTPRVHSTGQEGLLDVALHPRFAQNHLLYLTYSKEGPGGTTIALARGKLEGDVLQDVQDIFVADNWSRQDGNIGSRIAFRSDGTLLMTTGERHEQRPAQDPSNHSGKILRLRDDGSVPPDNPFAAMPAYRQEIFTLGHRNPQGLAIHPTTGVVYETEHGPLGGDELNVIVGGKNYGFPTVTYGRNYDGSSISNETSRPGMEEPLKYWVPSIAPSGLAIYTGDRFPKWRDNLFVGAMARRDVGTQLYRIDISTTPPHIESMLKSPPRRIRDVREGPDGLLYLLTDEGDDRLLRIEPR